MSGHYAIRVAGHLDRRWESWFDGLTLVRCVDGTTCLTGEVSDQAQLHSVLARIRDLGLDLISVEATDHPTTHPKESS